MPVWAGVESWCGTDPSEDTRTKVQLSATHLNFLSWITTTIYYSKPATKPARASAFVDCTE